MPRKNTAEYKWVIVVLCFLMIFLGLGFCSSNKSLYLAAITDALKVPRSAFSLNDSFRFISTAVVNIFFGTLIQKFGTKKLIIAGFACLISSCIVYAVAETVYVFYIGGCLLGIGLSWTTTTMIGYVIGKWCKKNKGTVMGAVLAANGIGAAIASQIVSPIIYEEGNPFGYRNAYFLMAGIGVVMLLLILFFYCEPLKDDGQPIPKNTKTQSWSGIEFSEVKRTPYFYLAVICIFLTGMILQGINGISAAHMRDAGLGSGYIATVVSVQSLVLAGSKFITGFIYDKRGLRLTVTICDLSAMIVMFVLAMITSSGSGKIFAMLYAVFASLALPLETVMLPIFAGDLFGEKAYTKTLGIFVSFNTAGYALGTPIMNKVFDSYGTYKPMFIVCAILMLIITLTTQYIISAAHKKRMQVAV